MKTQSLVKLVGSIFFMIQSYNGFAQSKKELILSYEKHVNISDDKKRELIEMFSARDNSDYYVIPMIPRRKLKKSSKRCYIAKSEVLVLIDAQLMGPAKDFLIIGTSGVYFKNGWSSEQPGRHFIPFEDFKTKEITLKRDEIAIGNLTFDPVGSFADMEFIINLLKDLQKKL